MTRHALPRARPWPHLATWFAATALLGACGGNDDTATTAAVAAPAPAPAASAPPAPPPAAPTFFDTATASADGVAQAGYVFDVDATPALKLSIADLGAIGQFWPSQARSVDPAAGTLTDLGAGQGTYVRAGKVYSVNLRKGGAPAEVQVSALSTACVLTDQFEVAADGSDTWFRVDEAGPDGDCATEADNRAAMVRTTGTATTAPVFLPSGTQMLQRLPNADMSLRWILANDTATEPPKLVLYGTDMTRAGDVAGGASAAQVTAVSGYDTPQPVAYLQAGTELKRLTWDAAGAALSASLYTFASSAYAGLGVSDAAATYFKDGTTLLRIVGSAAPSVVTAALPAGTRVDILRQTPTHLVFDTRPSGVFAGALMSVAKAGGALHTLTPSVVASQWGIYGEQAVFFVSRLSNNVGDWHRSNVDGSADTTIKTGVQRVGLLNEPTRPMGDLFGSLAGLFYCAVASGAVDCNAGSLVQYDLATDTHTALGNVAASSGATRVRATGNVLKGHGGKVRVAATDAGGVARQDVYLFKPSTAGSLVRLTTNLP